MKSYTAINDDPIDGLAVPRLDNLNLKGYSSTDMKMVKWIRVVSLTGTIQILK